MNMEYYPGIIKNTKPTRVKDNKPARNKKITTSVPVFSIIFNITLSVTLSVILIFSIIWAKIVRADEYLEGPANKDDFQFYDCYEDQEASSYIDQGVSNGLKTQQVPEINAKAAIVTDMATGRVLFEKDAYSPVPMASTTKIMTAIIAIEAGKLDEEVTVSKNAAKTLGSVINLQPGEKLTLEQLLYGLMLNSGNDAAVAIAEHIGGTVEQFLEMMNEKARILGARNTNFKSPHGLDLDGHYSTPFDLALITRYAMEHPTFSRIVSAKQITIPGRNLYNTNEMLEIYPGADGVKTGYTGKAGRCLVTSAIKKGTRLVSVVLNSPSRYARAQSSVKILDYCFSSYSYYTLLEPGEIIGYIPVEKGKTDFTPIGTVDKIVYPLTVEEFGRIEKKIWLNSKMNAPVFAGMDAGYIHFLLDDKVIAESKLKTWHEVERKDFRYYLDRIIEYWLTPDIM